MIDKPNCERIAPGLKWKGECIISMHSYVCALAIFSNTSWCFAFEFGAEAIHSTTTYLPGDKGASSSTFNVLSQLPVIRSW